MQSLQIESEISYFAVVETLLHNRAANISFAARSVKAKKEGPPP